MSNPKVAAGPSAPLLLAHRRQAGDGLPAASWFVSRSPSLHHRTNPLRLASVRAASTQARRGEFFSGSRRHPPPTYSVSLRTRTTKISSCSANLEMEFVGENACFQNMERRARIRKQLREPELLPSSYDTAWLAMVPLRGSSQVPCFPQCVEWIQKNQNNNGSWCLNQKKSGISKDVLSSTLACVLALKRWNIGLEHISRGLHFIGRNFSIVVDEKIVAPIGFNVTFSGMLNLAMAMGLKLPVTQTDIDGILHVREMELERLVMERSFGKYEYMSYVVEGLENMLDWNDVMKFQRKNGSLFNSPSATAALLIHKYDEKALQYLNLLVSKFDGSVPTVYPTNIYCQLSMVDSLEKIGISRHFSSEIKSILDMTYTFWLRGDEEIMMDIATCAMAFRLLRLNGYDVSSYEFSHVEEASSFHNSLQGYLKDTKSILELYKATKVSVSENESILDNIDHWSGCLLKEKLFSHGVQSRAIFSEVEYTLNFPFYATMERLHHKRNIEHFDARGSQMLKTENLPCIVNQDFLDLAVEDFTFSQSVYRHELQHVESWVKENRLDQLQFVRQRVTYCYFSAAGTIFPAELCDARITFTKNAILVIAADDFFDVAGSKEELENLVALIEQWDGHSEDDFSCDHVKILFSAIYNTTNQLGAMASVVQNRDVKKHLIQLWLQLLRSMMTETDWQIRKYVPSFEEYMANATVSFTLGVLVLQTLYFVGQKISANVVEDQDYNELFRLMSTCGRLLNDIQGCERESSQGKLDSVSLLVLHCSDGSMSTEAAKESIRRYITSCRKELLRLVLKKDSVVPKPCRELFWNMSQICHVFYSHTDGFTSPTETLNAANAVIHEPLQLQIRNPS